MVEEACRCRRRIDGYELMDRARGESFAHDFGRGYRTARDNRIAAIAGKQLIDERQRSHAFSDTRAVHPDEFSLRPRMRGKTQTFVRAFVVLLASQDSAPQQDRRKRRQQHRCKSIGDNAERRVVHRYACSTDAGGSSSLC